MENKVKKAVWKYNLDEVTKIGVPSGYQILTVQLQQGIPCVWILVNTENPKEEVTIKIYGTGHTIEDNIGKYLGTFQVASGTLIFHAFEVK